MVNSKAIDILKWSFGYGKARRVDHALFRFSYSKGRGKATGIFI